jgi:integrase
MTKRRAHGDGAIIPRGEGTYRLRYHVNKQRFSKTIHGTYKDAKEKLRALLHSGDTGEHVAPDKITLAEWVKG